MTADLLGLDTKTLGDWAIGLATLLGAAAALIALGAASRGLR